LLKTILASAAVLFPLCSNAAMADVGRSQFAPPFMKEADLNRDQVVTKEELVEWSRAKSATWGADVDPESRAIMLRLYMSTWERMSMLSGDGIVRIH